MASDISANPTNVHFHTGRNSPVNPKIKSQKRPIRDKSHSKLQDGALVVSEREHPNMEHANPNAKLSKALKFKQNPSYNKKMKY